MKSTHETYEEHILEPIKFKIQKRHENFAFNNTRLDYSRIGNEIYFEFNTMIFGKKKTQKYDITSYVPDGWWQHFKTECFSKWMLNKFPVKMKRVIRTIELDHIALFPELKDTRHKIIFHTPNPPDITINPTS